MLDSAAKARRKETLKAQQTTSNKTLPQPSTTTRERKSNNRTLNCRRRVLSQAPPHQVSLLELEGEKLVVQSISQPLA